jgi:F-box interacting protein
LDIESGDAMRNIKITSKEGRPTTDDHLVCLVSPHQRLYLLNVTSGVISVLPDHSPGPSYSVTSGFVGRTASTGQHKVLAISTSRMYNEEQICQICTVGNGGWRDLGSPPLTLMFHSRRVAVIGDIAFFVCPLIQSKDVARNIMQFDFSTEEWRPAECSLRGPANCRDISLAELDGHLVAGQADGYTSIELWFLIDSDQSLWAKKYTIEMPCHQNLGQVMCNEYFEKPLVVLRDGRIVVWMRLVRPTFRSGDGVLRVYDPERKTYRDGLPVPKCSYMAVFRWNLQQLNKKGPLHAAARRLLLGREDEQSGQRLGQKRRPS